MLIRYLLKTREHITYTQIIQPNALEKTGAWSPVLALEPFVEHMCRSGFRDFVCMCLVILSVALRRLTQDCRRLSSGPGHISCSLKR